MKEAKIPTKKFTYKEVLVKFDKEFLRYFDFYYYQRLLFFSYLDKIINYLYCRKKELIEYFLTKLIRKIKQERNVLKIYPNVSK